MQREDTEVEPQQSRMRQHLAQAAATGIALQRGLGRHYPGHDRHADQRQRGRQTEQAAQADLRRQQRRQREREREHQRDADADQRHRLVRTLSRVPSAMKAVTAAEIAPAPWIARPAISQCTLGAQTATPLPTANSARPARITGLRPSRSGRHAERDLQQRLRQAVDAHGQANQRGIVAAGDSAAPRARTPAAPGTGPACAGRR